MKTYATVFALLILSTAAAQRSEAPNAQLLEVVAAVEKAATSQDFEALAALMIDDFSYSFGESRSKSGAIAWYRTHPELLDRMVEVLSSTCTLTDMYGAPHYVCPVEAIDVKKPYYEYRAAFAFKDNKWQFAWFIAGD